MRIHPLIGLLLVLIVSSCQGPTETTPPAVEEPTAVKDQSTEERVDPAPMPDPYRIMEQGFYGVKPGFSIDEIPIHIEQGTLENGEGAFEVYYIIDEIDGEQLGYFLADAQDPTKAGTITVTTTKASLDNGLKVGATYGDLQRQFDHYEVHGSEIESCTYAIQGNWGFRLNYASSQYDMQLDEVPGTTPIISIDIYPEK